MANPVKVSFLEQLRTRYGKLKQLPGSLSLFEIGDGLARLYVRYSKLHAGNRTFFGLRRDDLKELGGVNSVICFLWDNQLEPMFVPFGDFEDTFSSLTPASDGQYKVQIYPEADAELYISNAGRFNVEGFYGWDNLDNILDQSKISALPDFSHSQIQTIIGSIGTIKGHDIWMPPLDRNKLDWSLAEEYALKSNFPTQYGHIYEIIKEIDVAWINRGSNNLLAMFEVEHSTPIYSGLLRFNDLHLIDPNSRIRFSIVANDFRRSLFLKQINRPTFKTSGLNDVCSFMEYRDVFN